MHTVALALEVPVFGIALLWLLALVPAAVVALLKDRLLLFLCGWLTFGLTWIVGALAIAPPDSWWARRFYGEEQLARAVDPIRYCRSRRTVLLWIAGVIASVTLVGFLAARPAPILGVNGDALENSVGGFLSSGPCEHPGERVWICDVQEGSDGVTSYRVSVRRLGCWSATRIASQGGWGRRHLSGCMNILDFVF